MTRAAVAIPIYKSQPTPAEQRSFQQCLQILGRHPICLVAPQHLDITVYNQIANRPLKTITFDSRFFESVNGYSELLLHRRFYSKFTDYHYILIYQLDAWVFRDELLDWCQQKFDYIGAPWLEAPPPTTKKPFINLGPLLKNKVGNGGVSLRNVQSHLRWAPWVSFVFKLFPKNEDMLWSLLVPFKKPKPIHALRFAFEMEPSRSYQLVGQTLPFTCHAWEKYEPQFWDKFIQSE